MRILIGHKRRPLASSNVEKNTWIFFLNNVECTLRQPLRDWPTPPARAAIGLFFFYFPRNIFFREKFRPMVDVVLILKVVIAFLQFRFAASVLVRYDFIFGTLCRCLFDGYAFDVWIQLLWIFFRSKMYLKIEWIRFMVNFIILWQTKI